MERSTTEACEMHAIVKGNVQGVGFRALTRYHALEMGIKGSVRNLPDGSVEIYAQGSKQRLEELIQRLKNEVTSGYVCDVVIEYFPIEHPHNGFRILI